MSHKHYMDKNEAEILGIEYQLDALREAKFVLENNPNSKYAPLFRENKAYADILDYIDMKIDLTKQALDLWKSGAIKHD